MIENFIDNFEDKLEQESAKGNAKKFGLTVVSLFLVALVFFVSGCTGGLEPSTPEPLVGIEPPQEVGSEMDEAPAKAPKADSADDIMVEPGTAKRPDPTATQKKDAKDDDLGAGMPVKKKKKSQEPVETGEMISFEDETMVTMVVADTGRPDPFQPAHEADFDPEAAAKAAEQERLAREMAVHNAKLQFDLVDPPLSATPDTDAEKIMTTKVSGIIYDEDSPSAILNIEGSDYLVRSGDVVNGYKILAINKTLVTVQLGANIYRAGVGELLMTDGIQHNTISNLEKKFGGSGRQ